MKTGSGRENRRPREQQKKKRKFKKTMESEKKSELLSPDFSALVLAMKICYPDYFWINRGNHEDITTNRKYAFAEQVFLYKKTTNNKEKRKEKKQNFGRITSSFLVFLYPKKKFFCWLFYLISFALLFSFLSSFPFSSSHSFQQKFHSLSFSSFFCFLFFHFISSARVSTEIT